MKEKTMIYWIENWKFKKLFYQMNIIF